MILAVLKNSAAAVVASIIIVDGVNINCKTILTGRVVPNAHLTRRHHLTNVNSQVHPLVADGDRSAAPCKALLGVVQEAVGNFRPLNSPNLSQGVGQDLGSVLTGAAASDRGMNVLGHANGGGTGNRVIQPVGTGQLSLVSTVASQNQRHLHGLTGGYLGVGIELGRRLAGNDASILQVLYVALRPVAGDVGERRGNAFVSGSVVVTAVANGVDHLGHLRAGDSAIRLERAILITLDYAKGREQVHGVGVISIDIRLVRERCRTGKHGERASERQHQCENLFLMAEDGLKNRVYLPKFHVSLNFSSQF